MKLSKTIILICISIYLNNLYAQSVGIGTTNPDSSAILDLSSTTKGFLMPRMTTAYRDAIVSPEVGLSIFNLQDKCIDIYNGTTWDKNCSQQNVGTYTILGNTWRPRSDFGGTARSDAIGFSIRTKGYIGTGNDGSYKKDFWEYDPNTNFWTQKADFGGTARERAVGFSIGTKGYIGTGYDGSYKKDFWEYNPSSNAWTQKADFGGIARSNAVGFFIETKGYIGTGIGLTGLKKDFWEYDPNTNTWIQKADFGGIARYFAVGFSIGTQGYIGTGIGNNGTSKKDFWEYDPNTNFWTQKADFGGTESSDAVGFSLGTNGYIGTGYGGIFKKDFWEYDPSSNTWTPKADFGGSARYDAVGFSIGTKGYIGIGNDGSNKKGFWEYATEPIIGKEYKETIPTETTKYTGHTWTLEHNKLYPSLEDANVLIKYNANLEFGSGLAKEQHAGKIGYKTFSSDGLDIVGAGTVYPYRRVRIYDRLYLQNILANRKIVLWEGADNDHQFYGFGINDGTLRYQSEGIHRFYTGNSANTSNLLMTIYGNGNVTIGGSLTQNSDATLKKNILPIASSLSSLFALKGYNYNWKDEAKDQSLQSGFLAQEVEKLFPHLVKKDEQGLLSVNYIGLMPYMLEGMKLQQAQIENLLKENDELKVKSEELEKDNILLKTEISLLKNDIEKILSLLEAKKIVR